MVLIILFDRTCGCEANKNHVLQRKVREEHDEESYFEGGDDDQLPEQQHPPNTVVPPAVDEVAAQEGIDVSQADEFLRDVAALLEKYQG